MTGADGAVRCHDFDDSVIEGKLISEECESCRKSDGEHEKNEEKSDKPNLDQKPTETREAAGEKNAEVENISGEGPAAWGEGTDGAGEGQ